MLKLRNLVLSLLPSVRALFLAPPLPSTIPPPPSKFSFSLDGPDLSVLVSLPRQATCARREWMHRGNIFLASIPPSPRSSIHNMHMLLSSCPCWARFCWAIRGLRINFSCVRDATTDATAEPSPPRSIQARSPRNGARRFAIHAESRYYYQLIGLK